MGSIVTTKTSIEKLSGLCYHNSMKIPCSSGCEQMVTEPTHVDGGVLDLVLTDVPDIIGVRVSSPGVPSDHSAVFIMFIMLCTHLTWCVGRRSISRTL